MDVVWLMCVMMYVWVWVWQVAIFGDMGVHNSEHTMATLTDMHAHRHYDFIWHVGTHMQY